MRVVGKKNRGGHGKKRPDRSQEEEREERQTEKKKKYKRRFSETNILRKRRENYKSEHFSYRIAVQIVANSNSLVKNSFPEIF